ncbi:hypothetical protein ES702_07819 [subsurface metagenome]
MDPKPKLLTFLAISIRAQSPEKQPSLARVAVSTKTNDSSSSCGEGFGCSISEGTFDKSASVRKTLPGRTPARAVVAVKLE